MSMDRRELAGGRYHLIRQIGSGGMATVYEAVDTRLRVRRAVKVLSQEYFGKPRIRERFEAEAQVMVRLAHRNIVAVQDLGVDGDTAYIVMELLEGGSLADRLERRGPIPPRQACLWLADVLDALGRAHALEVYHRDLKPQNILLGADGVPRLGDFGIAHLSEVLVEELWSDADRPHRETKTSMSMGTVPYMSPEQRQDAKRVGPPADVYAAGCTLYALLTAETPQDFYVVEARAAQIDGLPDVLREIIERATQYLPGERYPSAAEMRGALLAAVGRLPVDDEPLPRRGPVVVAPPAPRASTWADDPGGLGDAAPPAAPTVAVAASASASPTVRREPPPDRPTALGETWISPPAGDGPAGADPSGRSRRWGMAAAAVAVCLGLAAVGAVGAGLGGGARLAASPVAPAPAPAPVRLPAPPPGTAPAPAPAPAAPDPAPARPAPAPAAAAVRPSAPAPRPEAPPAPGVGTVSAVPAPAPVPVPAPSPLPAPAGPTARARFATATPATVWIDGVDRGAAPFEGMLAVGKHKVVLRATAGGEYSRTVTVAEGVPTSYCHDFEANAPCR
jgi:tRNA A-37 threonylcarbamoyl transferase component Bud32